MKVLFTFLKFFTPALLLSVGIVAVTLFFFLVTGMALAYVESDLFRKYWLAFFILPPAAVFGFAAFMFYNQSSKLALSQNMRIILSVIMFLLFPSTFGFLYLLMLIIWYLS